MLRFQRGEEAAFVELYRGNRDRIVNFTRRFLGSAARGEEAAQDVFLKLYDAKKSYKPASRFSTFLYRVATNHCLNLRARKDAQPTPELDTEREQGPEGAGPDDAVKNARLRQDLRWALAQLPDNQRAAIVLCHYEGMSYREAADALAVSEAAIKSLVHRARTTLAQLLSGWLQEAQGAKA